MTNLISVSPRQRKRVPSVLRKHLFAEEEEFSAIVTFHDLLEEHMWPNMAGWSPLFSSDQNEPQICHCNAVQRFRPKQLI
jgi:hypothetical protein